MEIRNSTPGDMEEILHIFAKAKKYMDAHGNATQWGDGYPGEAVLRRDIEQKNSYVILENGTIVGTFFFIIGEEPNYRVIWDGKWNLDIPYGTIHRVASDGTTRGVARACFDFCSRQIDYLRIDTHRDNQSMQAAILKYGFRKCGIIRVENGSERLAFVFKRQK